MGKKKDKTTEPCAMPDTSNPIDNLSLEDLKTLQQGIMPRAHRNISALRPTSGPIIEPSSIQNTSSYDSSHRHVSTGEDFLKKKIISKLLDAKNIQFEFVLSFDKVKDGEVKMNILILIKKDGETIKTLTDEQDIDILNFDFQEYVMGWQKSIESL